MPTMAPGTRSRKSLICSSLHRHVPTSWTSPRLRFVEQYRKRAVLDLTATKELEAHRVAVANGFKVDKRQSASFPSAAAHQAEANPLINQISKTNPKTWATTLTNIHNRYYRGSYAASSATTVFNLVKNVAAANTKITVKQFTHSYNQPSVIATIPGTSASVVVVSGHFDSINQANPTTGRAPGADDNASVSRKFAYGIAD